MLSSFCAQTLQTPLDALLRDPQVIPHRARLLTITATLSAADARIWLLGRLVLDHRTHPNPASALQPHPSPHQAPTPLDPARRALRRLEQHIEAAAQLV